MFKRDLPEQYSGKIGDSTTGIIVLNGYTYQVSNENSKINEMSINGLSLQIKNGLIYLSNGKEFNNSSEQKVIEEAYKRYKEKPIQVPPPPPILPPIQRPVEIETVPNVDQKETSVDHLTMSKFQEKNTLFDKPYMPLVLVAGAFLLLSKLK
jgi:hypothetical protein